MERKENQPMSEGICRRLFNFIVNSLTARGLKRVTLGHPSVPGSPQEPFLNATQNGDPLTKPSDGERYVQTPAHEAPMNGMDSMIFVEVEQANGFKDYNPTSPPIEGDNENQMQKDLNVWLSTPKTIPVEDQGSNNKANGSKDHVREKDQSMSSTTSISQVHDSNMVSEPVKTQTNESEIVLGSSAPKKTASAPKKTVSIKDGSKDDDMFKKKEKNVMREKLTLAIEPEKDVNVNSPRTLRPTLRSASNINEKSDDFIRRRREALKKSLSNEPRPS